MIATSRSMRRVVAIAAVLWTAGIVDARAQTRQTVTIRGQEQTLHAYGGRGGIPVIVSSGDGGWIHLGPHVAEVLAAKGFFVVGFDVRAYLERFTSGTTTLHPSDASADYGVLAEFAARGSNQRPILVGVSEGAGLSVLAATDPRLKAQIGGVIGLGLPDLNELGWRWKDALIYSTHRAPNEPSFSVAAIADRVAPVPLGAIHSTRDEFVPLEEVQRVMSRAQDPKKLWVIDAADHRFSNNLTEFDRCLLEAVAWITAHSAK